MIYKELLLKWHSQVVDRLRKFCNSIINSSSNTWSNMNQQSQAAANLNNGQKLLKRLEMDLFPGFMPAVNICSVDWSAFELNTEDLFRKECLKQVASLTMDEAPRLDRQDQQTTIKITTQVSSSSSCSSSSSAASSSMSLSSSTSCSQPLQDVFKALTAGDLATRQSESLRPKELESSKFQTTKSDESGPLDVLFYRCEALYFHAFIPQACILAHTLAEHLLSTGRRVQSLFNGVDEEERRK